MKSKTLIGLAVASTFAWSAAAFAGSSHEVMTPLSANETGPVLVSHQQSFGHEPTSGFATSSAEHTILGSPLSDNTDWTGSVDQVAMSDQGMSSEYVAWIPVTIETWDVYVMDGDPVALMGEALDYSYLVLPSDEDQLAMSSDESSDVLAMSESSDEYAQVGESDYVPAGSVQEDLVAYTLYMSPVDDTAEVG